MNPVPGVDGMKRSARAAVVLGATLILAPPAVDAQAPNRQAVVVYLWDAPAGTQPPEYFAAFRETLRALGRPEGAKLRIERRIVPEVEDRPRIKAEITALRPDVIVAPGPAALIFGPVPEKIGARFRYWSPIHGIPIVFSAISDPIGLGMVQSLARPGGTLTGITTIAADLNVKRLQLLKDTLPRLTRVGVIVNPTHPLRDRWLQELAAAGRSLAVEIQVVDVPVDDPPDHAFEDLRRGRAQAVLGLPSASFFRDRKRIGELALMHRLPTIFESEDFAEAGCLMTYAPNGIEMSRQAAEFADKLLKGARPETLPVDQPRKLDLLVNVKTARALGLTIPPEILLRADRLIE
jgi:putative ABC transport system substrate-binding protein